MTMATYVHKCDILEKFSDWDFDSHTSNDRWEIVETDVPCNASSFVNGGIRGNGTMEQWDEGKYISEDFIRLKTKRAILKSQRITNIRALNGEVVWKEEEFGGEPTLFNVDGSAPVADPFSGVALEFITTLSRAEIQNGD